jgi:hypothetical protein
MASHGAAGGRFRLRSMLSLDVATVTDGGYPSLLQTGESVRGQPIHDRRHAHAFFMELGFLCERAVIRGLGVELCVGPSREPTLEPVAYTESDLWS